MTISSLALRTTNTTITQACWELRTSSGVRPKILEVSVIQSSNTAQSLGFGRPAAQGITPVNNAFVMDDTGEPNSTLNASLSWATSPTAPTVYHRRWNSAATAAVGIIWVFPRGLTVAVSASLVIFNITAGVANDISCVADE